MKLLGNSKNKINKDKNGENVPHDGIKVWFTDQTSKPLEIEGRINLSMIIK